jgi:hypothetical protein
MRAGHKKPPARHWNAEPAFAIVTDNDHLLRVRRRAPLCGSLGVKRAFSLRSEIVFRPDVKRGSASVADQYGLPLRDGENRNEEEREILPEAVFPHVGQEAASAAMLPQTQPIFHRRLDRLGAKDDEHMRALKSSSC